MTARTIKNLKKGAVQKIEMPDGSLLLKYFARENSYIVVTWAGLLKFADDASIAYSLGEKGQHYREFQCPVQTAQYIRTQVAYHLTK